MAITSALKKNVSHFAQVPAVDIQRSVFDRGHSYKTTFDSGYLVPFYLDEVLPGDTFQASISMLARLSTPIVPFMDRLKLETFYFFVPNRLLWNGWKSFMGEQRFPTDTLAPSMPTISITPDYLGTSESSGKSRLADYFGLPPQGGAQRVNALPFRAYNLIWNEWFRDENLQQSAPFTDDMSDASDQGLDKNGSGTKESWKWYIDCRKRGKRHDYFTSCLPWPQKGDPVSLPLGGSAPVYGSGPLVQTAYDLNYNPQSPLSNDPFTKSLGTAHMEEGWWPKMDGFVTTSTSNQYATGLIQRGQANPGLGGQTTWNSGVYTDLTQATAATVNSLRQAIQLQRFYERSARGGSRYIEQIRTHFSVISPDARLQRPEILGYTTSDMNIQPIVQTSSTDSTSPQGNLAAQGVLIDNQFAFSKTFTEHGYILGIVCVTTDLTYQQGRHKLWDRKTRFDFYWPEFAHLGEQAVLNSEIYADGSSADNQVFGYQERYGEYRFFPGQITGLLRSGVYGSLDVWHLAQCFANLPTLNATFIEENPPLHRVLAVQDEPHIIFDSFMSLKCSRPMPVYSVPGLMDHF